MSSEETCLKFLDELTSRQPLSEKACLHVACCSSCRQLYELHQKLGQVERAISEPVPPKLRARLMKLTVPPASPAKPLLHWFLGAVLLLAVGIGVFFYVKRMPPPGFAPEPEFKPYHVARSGGSVILVQSPEAFALAVGQEAELRLSDGSVITLVGPVDCLVRDRHLCLDSGHGVACIAPDSKPFRMLVPQGYIEVTGTRFSFAVSRSQTRVDLHEGKLAIGRHPAFRQILQAGQTGIIDDLSPRVVSPASITCPLPASESRTIPHPDE